MEVFLFVCFVAKSLKMEFIIASKKVYVHCLSKIIEISKQH